MATVKAKSSEASVSGREIVVSRVFDAPRELVWKAWSDPAHVSEWWGPRGFTTTTHEIDFRPGGVWRHTMHGPDGTDYPSMCVFHEIVKPERVVYSLNGGKKGIGDVQAEVIWIFEAQGEKTKLTLRMLFSSSASREHVAREYGAREGGVQTLERLEEYLATSAAR